MLEWVIIGGGVHGTALSLALTRRNGVPLDRMRVVDPHPQPLHYWTHFTANVGMAYLRSPGVHHLHYDPWYVRTFRETRRGKPLAASIPRYERPSLAFFQAFTDLLLSRYNLQAMRAQAWAHGLKRLHGGWQVETSHGALTTRRVLLAIGNSENPTYPAWADTTSAAYHHIFDSQFDRQALADWSHVVVVGGGISAGQTALALATQQPGTVTLLSRHAARIHDFDSDPCWVSALCLDDFHRVDDPHQRRAIIQQTRHRGSMPYDIQAQLQAAQEAGALRWLHAEVVRAEADTLYTNDGRTLQADHIVLCTGFDRARPGGAWLAAVIQAEGLPLAPDGYPLVDERLCWADGLYASGPLAELEIGPVSRNIIGARLAAERIHHI